MNIKQQTTRRLIEIADYVQYKKINGIDSDMAFSEVIELEQQNMSKLRNGKRWASLDMLYKIHSVFGVPYEWLIEGKVAGKAYKVEEIV